MRGRWPARRSATTSTARTRRSRRWRSGSRSCSATRPRCSPPPARWPTCSPSARLVGPGEEVLCESSRPHRARRARRPRRHHRSHDAHLDDTRAASVDLPAIEAMLAPDMGPFFVRDRRGLGREHPQLRRRRGAADRGPAARCGRAPTTAGPASTSTARGSGTRTSRPATPLAEYGARRRRARGLPVQGPRRPDRLADGRLGGRDRRGAGAGASGWAAGCVRSACSRRPACYALDHHVERLADDHAHARLLAEALRRRPGGVDTNIVVVERPDAAAFVDGCREPRACCIAAVGPRTVRLVTHLDVSRRTPSVRPRCSAGSPPVMLTSLIAV